MRSQVFSQEKDCQARIARLLLLQDVGEHHRGSATLETACYRDADFANY